MRSRRWLVALILAACSCSRPKPAHELERVDVFGSKKLDRDAVLARWGDQLAAIVRDPTVDERLLVVKSSLEGEILASGGLAFVELSMVTYPRPKGTFITVDLVDEADRERRMTFAPEPTGTLPDPDDLLALWQEYEPKAMALSMEGKVNKDEKCPFWHCISFGHESLVPYRDAFAARVPPVEAELAAVLREDETPRNRAAAAYLLAHLASGPRVVELVSPAVTDPNGLVRNNAMRVLAHMAYEHPDVEIPVDPFVRALHYPLTTDRNKAAAILAGVSKHASAATRAAILDGAGEVLLEMLALRQPNNHNFAYLILKQVSERDLGENDVAAWRAWLQAQRKR